MPRSPAALALALVAATALAGCASDAPEPDRVVSGDVEWSRPARELLQVSVVSAAGLHTIVDFAKGEWYVAGLERAIAEGKVREATVRAVETGLFEEVRALDAEAPGALAAFRLDRVQAARAEQGKPVTAEALEAEWERVIQAVESGEAPAVRVIKPGASVPPPRVPVPTSPRAMDDGASDDPPAANEPPSSDDEADDAGAGDVPEIPTVPLDGDGLDGGTSDLDPEGGLDANETLAEDPSIEDPLANATDPLDPPAIPTSGGLLG